MADPLGISASIIAILQLSKKLVECINQVKAATEDCRSILTEITSSSYIITLLSDKLVQNQNETWAATADSLLMPGGPLEQFERVLKRLASKLEPAASGTKKAIKALKWPFEKAEVREMLVSIERQKSLFSLALQNDHIGLSRAIKDDLSLVQTGIEGINARVSQLQTSQQRQEDHVRDQKLRDIAAWLSNLNFATLQNDIFSRRHIETGNWILEHRTYQQWLLAGGTLWCPGIPGAGKTVIASIIIDSLKSAVEKGNHGLAYVYLNYNESDNQTTRDLLASLLQQLMQQLQIPPDTIIQLYNSHAPRSTKPSINELSNALGLLILDFPKTFLIIDALDECNESSRSSFLAEIRNLLPRVHLLITSRPNIEPDLPDLTRLDICANDRDIIRYLNARIAVERRLNSIIGGDLSLQREIVSSILQRSQGMFLLPKLHIESLAKKTNKRSLRSALETLPKEINDTYDEAMRRIQDQTEEETELALRALMWTSFVLKPLRTIELRHALAIEPSQTDIDLEALVDEETLLSVCAGLITVDDESGIVRLVHFTTQEYFRNANHKYFPFAHQRILETCLTYLCFDCFVHNDVFENNSRSLKSVHAYFQKYPFLRYATLNWAYHARKDEMSVSKSLINFLGDDLKTQTPGRLLCQWQKGFEYYAYGSWSGFLMASFFDLRYTVTALIDHGIHADVSCSTEEQAIHIAASRGYEELIQLLLDNGAEVDARAPNGWTALHFAASNGQMKVIQLLHKNGADLEARGSSGLTPVELAVLLDNRETVCRLLDLGADGRNVRDPRDLLS